MVLPRSLRAYDGVDVLATADLDDKLVVRLWPVGNEKENRHVEKIALADLVAGSRSSVIDSQGNQLLVSRSPGDRFARRVCTPVAGVRAGRGVERVAGTPSTRDCPPARR